jgi:hypothetical protein
MQHHGGDYRNAIASWHGAVNTRLKRSVSVRCEDDSVQPDWVPASRPLVAKHQHKPGRRPSLHNECLRALTKKRKGLLGANLIANAPSSETDRQIVLPFHVD